MLLIICVVTLELSACDAAERSMDESMTVQATIIEIEKYGHAVLDITTADFVAAGYELGDIVCVRFGMMEFTMPFYDGYYTNPGTVMLRGRTPESNIAICINYGDFSGETGTAVGDRGDCDDFDCRYFVRQNGQSAEFYFVRLYHLGCNGGFVRVHLPRKHGGDF